MDFDKRRANWKAIAIIAAVAVPVIGGAGAIYKYWPELISLAERFTKKEPTCSYGPITVEPGAALSLTCVARDTSINQTIVAEHSMNRMLPKQAPKTAAPPEPNVAKQEQPAGERLADRLDAFSETPKYPNLIDNFREQFALAPITSAKVLASDESKAGGRPALVTKQKQVTRVAVRFVRVLTYEQGDADDLIPALIKVPCTNTFMPEVCHMPLKNRRNIILRIP
jgi:hypothetical protein